MGQLARELEEQDIYLQKWKEKQELNRIKKMNKRFKMKKFFDAISKR